MTDLTYYIIRTEVGKERYVASQIMELAVELAVQFSVLDPMGLVVVPVRYKGRNTQERRTKEVRIIPSNIFVQTPLLYLPYLARLNGVASYMRHKDGTPCTISYAEMMLFYGRILKQRAIASRALSTGKDTAVKKQWRRLSDISQEMLARATSGSVDDLEQYAA